MTGTLWAVLSTLGPIAITLMLVVIGLLSERLGAVTRMPPYYRWFFVAALFTSLSIAARLVAATGGNTEFLAVVYLTGLTIGLTIGLSAAWYYWRWLFSERQ